MTPASSITTRHPAPSDAGAALAVRRGLLWALTVLGGLAAGFFTTWQISVMRGLALLDDRSFVAAMNAFNDTVRTGWFAVIFFGTGVLGVVMAIAELARARRLSVRSSLLLAGAVLYVVGVLLVTTQVNLPLNAELGLTRDGQDQAMAAARSDYEAPWRQANLVRTLASLAALGAFSAAAMVTVSGGDRREPRSAAAQPAAPR